MKKKENRALQKRYFPVILVTPARKDLDEATLYLIGKPV